MDGCQGKRSRVKGEGGEKLYGKSELDDNRKREQLMANMHETAALQDRIVLCFANDVVEQWDFLLVSFGLEEDSDDDGMVSSIVELVFQRQRNRWNRGSVIAPLEGQNLLRDLAQLMSNGNQTWRGCTLEIESTGKYRFAFSHELPDWVHGPLVEHPIPDYVPQALP